LAGKTEIETKDKWERVDRDKVKWLKSNPNSDHVVLWNKIDSTRQEMLEHCTRRSGEISSRIKRLENRFDALGGDVGYIRGKVDALYKLIPPLLVLILSFIVGLLILIFTRQPAWLPF